MRRPKGERLNPMYCKVTVKHGGGGIMVWGCFSGKGMGPIHHIDGIMDRFMYRDILQNLMLPYAENEMPLQYRFQQDNEPKRTSKICKEWLQNNRIQVLNWLAQSPDLKPIENLWEIVNMKINQENCKNKTDLFQTLKIAWKGIMLDTINNVMSSMPRRCAYVIQNKGFATKY